MASIEERLDRLEKLMEHGESISQRFDVLTAIFDTYCHDQGRTRESLAFRQLTLTDIIDKRFGIQAENFGFIPIGGTIILFEGNVFVEHMLLFAGIFAPELYPNIEMWIEVEGLVRSIFSAEEGWASLDHRSFCYTNLCVVKANTKFRVILRNYSAIPYYNPTIFPNVYLFGPRHNLDIGKWNLEGLGVMSGPRIQLSME